MQLDMRWRWWIGVVSVALGIGSAAPAELLPFSEGRLTLSFGSLYGLAMPAVEDPALTGTIDVTRSESGAVTQLVMPAGLFQGTTRVTFAGAGPFPPAKGVELDVSIDAGTFAPAPTGTATSAPLVLGGVVPLAGIHRVCLFFACGDPNATNLTVPLDPIGQGGIASAFVLLRVAIAGESWSTGSVTVDLDGGMTDMITGGTTATPNGGTHIQLVAPLMISTNAVTPGDEDVPPVRGLALLNLIVAPEPAQTAGLAAAIAALLWLGARRRLV
jgi:hypothetical protein